jgi:hypothetical protein
MEAEKSYLRLPISLNSKETLRDSSASSYGSCLQTFRSPCSAAAPLGPLPERRASTSISTGHCYSRALWAVLQGLVTANIQHCVNIAFRLGPRWVRQRISGQREGREHPLLSLLQVPAARAPFSVKQPHLRGPVRSWAHR